MTKQARVALTIGNFDGVHRGHKAMLDDISKYKREHDDVEKTVVVTFEPHPSEILGQKKVCRLTSSAQKIDYLQHNGIDQIIVMPFNEEFSKISADEFLDQVLLENLNIAYIAIGHNFYYGHNREGTPGKLLDWAQKNKFKASIVNGVESDGGTISSTRIRELIQNGQMVMAGRLLGRDYALEGEVIHGDKRGKQLGYPTANVIPQNIGQSPPCLPPNGVYVTSTTVEDRTFPSITNVGVKPTVSQKGQLVVESHLFNFDEDLYGKWLTVEFRDRIREEKKFASVDELVKQIQQDTAIAKAKLELK